MEPDEEKQANEQEPVHEELTGGRIPGRESLGIYGVLVVIAGLAIMVRKVQTQRSFLWLLPLRDFEHSDATTQLSRTWAEANLNQATVAEVPDQDTRIGRLTEYARR